MSLTKNKKIILCTTQRSGSTMIVEDMRNTGLLGLPEEYFIPWTPDQRDQDWAERRRGLLNRGRSENGVFAMKVMADQLRRADACLGLADQAEDQKWPQTAAPFPHFYHMFEEAVWVYLVRRDTVRQAISRVMSRQTGVNHATGEASDAHFAGNLMKGYKEDYNTGTRFDFDAIDQAAIAIERENMIWRRFFDAWHISPYQLYYEDVARDFPGYLHQIAEVAGIALPQTLEARKMVKLSNARNDEWVARYTDMLIADIPRTLG